MFDRVELLPLVIGEDRPLVFDFTNELQVGETISSAIVSTSLFTGNDPTPSTFLQGSPTISGPTVQQNGKPLVAGVIYNMLAKATTSFGNTYCKLAYQAILPVDNVASDQPDPSVSNVVARFDTGLISVPVNLTPILTATANTNGGSYQVNQYLTISVTGSAGLLNFSLRWTDRLSNLPQVKIGAVLGTLSLGSSSSTFPIDAAPLTQVLVQVAGGGFLDPNFTYQAECVVTRL